ncbi:polyamine aminopropyltransferase [Aquifex pyrophilus]
MRKSTVLKLCIFFTGFSGLVAEYSVATLATYLLGNAVFQWSVIISLFLLFMGIGSRLTRYIPDNKLVDIFVIAEVSLSLLVSLSPLIAYHFGSYPFELRVVIYSLSALIGTLIGLEIPIAVRINNRYEELKVNLSSILEKDYLGSLPAGLLYAYFLLPKLGLPYTTLIAGLLNLSVAILFSLSFPVRLTLKVLPLLVGLILALYGFFASRIILYEEQRFYGEQIVSFIQTPFQKVVLTKYKNIYSLYLDGHIQFSTLDEKRYHETLVHIPASLIKSYEKALILGGGDGLALREVLKYPFGSITLVDLDGKFVDFSRKNPIMRKINEDSFKDPRVKVILNDAFNFVFKTNEKFDLVVIDLIDPRTYSSARVYSLEFYKRLKRVLKRDGVFITQAGDVFFRRKVFCAILKTIREAGFYTMPLVVNIPSMGEWGFIVGSKEKKRFKALKIKNLSYLSDNLARAIILTGSSVRCGEEEINRILKPIVLEYYYIGN